MKETGGVKIVFDSYTETADRIICVSDPSFFYVLKQLEEYSQAVKVVNRYKTHVAAFPYRILIDGRASTNNHMDLYNLTAGLKNLAKHVENSNIQCTLLLDEESPIPRNVFGDVT